MKQGETMCYYRARGGQKSVYITIIYDNNILRESIIQNHECNYKQPLNNENSSDYPTTQRSTFSA